MSARARVCVCLCSFIVKKPPKFCMWEAFFLALLRCFLQIYFSSLIQTWHIYPTYTQVFFLWWNRYWKILKEILQFVTNISHFAGPLPTVDHYWGDSLTWFLTGIFTKKSRGPKGQGESHKEVGAPKLRWENWI